MSSKKKGSLQVDFAVGAAIFLTAFAFTLYFLVNFFSTVSEPLNEIQVKGRSVAQILIDSSGIPNDWEYQDGVSRVGLEKTIHRIPIVVESDKFREDWPIEASVDFDGNANLSSVRVTNFTNSIIKSQLEEEKNETDIAFITNLSSGDNIFYVYFSKQEINDTNLANMTFGSSDLDGCSKFTDSNINNYTVCEGNGTTSNRAGLIKVDDGTNDISDGNRSIDNPYFFGGSLTSDDSFSFSTISEGTIFTKYQISHDAEDLDINYTFYNNSPIWKADVSWSGSSSELVMTSHTDSSTFTSFEDSEGNSEDINSTYQTFQADYGIADDGTNVFASAVISDNNYDFSWQDNSNFDFAPMINSSSSLTSDDFTIWHSFESGNITTARDLFVQPNVTVLPTESINGIGIDKVDKMNTNVSYETAVSSLDLGRDEFFLDIENSTDTILDYGQDGDDTNIYVRSGKRIMQRKSGEIEYVRYILGVWR